MVTGRSAQDFKGFEETPEDATKEVVHLMNELDLGVSSEGVGELISSCSEPMANVDLIDIQTENKTPPEAEYDDCQSPPTKTLIVKKKKAFDHLEQFSSIMEECDPYAERSLQVCRAVDRDTACYKCMYQEKKASVQLFLGHFFKKVDKMPSASTSSQH
jgi:hypothetical protein